MAIDYKKVFSDVGYDLLRTVHDAGNNVINEAVAEERSWGISRAVDSMLECEVPDGKIIEMLQKYWDLRLSEAKEVLTSAREEFKDKD